MSRFIIITLIVGCVSGGSDPKPDATPGCDSGVEIAADAPVDAMTDAQDCWMYKQYVCGDEILNICVPYTGCATFMCDGNQYGYCGPGGL